MSVENVTTRLNLTKSDAKGDLASNVAPSSVMDIAEIPDEQAMKIALEGLEVPDNICLDNLDDFDKKITDTDPFSKVHDLNETFGERQSEISSLILDILDKTESELILHTSTIDETKQNSPRQVQNNDHDEETEEAREKAKGEKHIDSREQAQLQVKQSKSISEHEVDDVSGPVSDEKCTDKEDSDRLQNLAEQQTLESPKQQLVPADEAISAEELSEKQSTIQSSQAQQFEEKKENDFQQLGQNSEQQSNSALKEQHDEPQQQESDETTNSHRQQQLSGKIAEGGNNSEHEVIEETSRTEFRRESGQRRKKQPAHETNLEPVLTSTEEPELGRRRSKRNLIAAKPPQTPQEPTPQSKSEKIKPDKSKVEQDDSCDNGVDDDKTEGKLPEKVTQKSTKSKHSKKSIEPPKIALQRRPSKRPHKSEDDETNDEPPTKSVNKQPRETLIHKFTKINPSNTKTTSFDDRRSLPASSFNRNGSQLNNFEDKKYKCSDCNSYGTNNLNLFVIHRQKMCKTTLASYQGRVDEYKLSLVKPKFNKRSSARQ